MKRNKIPISETHKELIDTEWDYKKNNKLGLYPTKLTHGSEKKVWWKCKKKHEWKASIGNRCINGTRCPYCAGRKACKDNCLSTTHPKLLKEWNYEKNNKLELFPTKLTYGSRKKIWWKCKKEHEWKATIYNKDQERRRGKGGKGCPYCYGQKICKDNCLLTTHPKLAEKWHPIKNNKLTPKDITHGSHKKVWWMCDKGHVWKATCYNATCYNKIKENKCPYCAGQKVCKDNCLLTKNPKLAKEWHPTKNGKLTPNNVTSGTDKKAWWRCKNGHDWKAAIGSRSRGAGCHKCAIINLTGKNSPHYNPNLTDEDRIDRRLIPENKEWRKKVYTRDYWTCQICGRKNMGINAHHLMGYNKYPKLRFKIDNGITLCSDCHKNFHKIYGSGNNTSQQFEEYKKYKNNNILTASA